VRYGRRVEARTLEEMYRETRGQGFGAEVKRRIMLGAYVLRSGYYDAYYRKAQQVRTLITRDFERAFGEVDLMVAPTSPTPAFALGEKTADPLSMYLADIFTISCNLAGLPGLSVPCGLAGGRLPIGLQLLAPPLGEEALLRAGAAYQRLTSWHLRRPGLAS
jgi:aspartyl-tRNA(Asn)/glutamyl-tRNA(Gln) amidotransferase subunit A